MVRQTLIRATVRVAGPTSGWSPARHTASPTNRASEEWPESELEELDTETQENIGGFQETGKALGEDLRSVAQAHFQRLCSMERVSNIENVSEWVWEHEGVRDEARRVSPRMSVPQQETIQRRNDNDHKRESQKSSSECSPESPRTNHGGRAM